MARAVSTDFMQSFKFRVVEGAGGFLNRVAGFASASIPDLSVPEVNYREGDYEFTRKYPSIPEVGNVTLRRGLARGSSDFVNWIYAALRGNEYRTDLHRTDKKKPSISYILQNAFPVRVKMADDLDANTGDVSMEEIELAVEKTDIRKVSGGIGTTLEAVTSNLGLVTRG